MEHVRVRRHADELASAAQEEAVPTPTRFPAAVPGLLGGPAVPAVPAVEVGAVDDRAEHEADAIAGRVVATLRQVSSPAAGWSTAPPALTDPLRALRRTTRPGPGREGGRLAAVDASAVQAGRAGGSPLPQALRRQLEPALQADLSAVRVHAGPLASELADRVQAEAFTVGSDVFFRDGLPDQTTSAGQYLLAHELAHTVQQRPSTQVRRSFMPATVTKRTRLHELVEVAGTGDEPATVTDRGTVGKNLPLESDVVVDPADVRKSGKEFWTRGLAQSPSDWDPVRDKQARTWLRGSKLRGTGYPQNGRWTTYGGRASQQVTVYWHEDFGEFHRVADHPLGGGRWLVRRMRDGGKASCASGGTGAFELFAGGPLAIAVDEAYGDVVRKGTAPDGCWIYSPARTINRYFKYDSATGNRHGEAPLTEEEMIAVRENAQKLRSDEHLRGTPSLAEPEMTEIAYREVTVRVMGDPQSDRYEERLAAVRAALERLSRSPIPVALPDGLELYLAMDGSQVAYHFGAGRIFLTAGMFADSPPAPDAGGVRGGRGIAGAIRGVTHHLADAARQEDPRAKQQLIGCGTVVHEVGHVAHSRNDPALFFATQSPDFHLSSLSGLKGADGSTAVTVDEKRLREAAGDVSAYAERQDSHSSLVLEFVAEVFTGILGATPYPREVIDLYSALGGPTTWTDLEQVVEPG